MGGTGSGGKPGAGSQRARRKADSFTLAVISNLRFSPGLKVEGRWVSTVYGSGTVLECRSNGAHVIQVQNAKFGRREVIKSAWFSLV